MRAAYRRGINKETMATRAQSRAVGFNEMRWNEMRRNEKDEKEPNSRLLVRGLIITGAGGAARLRIERTTRPDSCSGAAAAASELGRISQLDTSKQVPRTGRSQSIANDISHYEQSVA